MRTSTGAATRVEVGGVVGCGKLLRRRGSVDQWEQSAGAI
jgi:hypothetical protein